MVFDVLAYPARASDGLSFSLLVKRDCLELRTVFSFNLKVAVGFRDREEKGVCSGLPVKAQWIILFRITGYNVGRRCAAGKGLLELFYRLQTQITTGTFYFVYPCSGE